MFGTLTRQRRAATCATALLTILALGACEDEADPIGPGGGGGEAALNTIVSSGPLNTESSDTLIAFSLATNSVVPKSGDWDILLRRYEIRLNSPTTAGATSKNVTAYAVGNNKNKTDAEVLALTVDNTLAEFDAFRASSIPADNQFSAERLIENTNAYLNLSGVPSANAANYWKIKTANGGYAVVHVPQISLQPPTFAFTSITFESRLQNGASLGAPQTVTVPLASEAVVVSLVTNSVVTPNGCNWDLSIDPETFDLTTNTACNVGTYPGGSSPSFTAVTTANDAPQYATYISELGVPIPNSVTDPVASFRYDLVPESHRLFPTFNTYLIKVGAKVYKMQVTNYYGLTGASGWLSIRAARIQ